MNKNIISAPALLEQVELVQEIVRSVMRAGEHYGVIPGTKKNSLFQTGAQKLLATFRLGSDQEVINTDETDSSVSYRVKVRLFNIADGNTVGYGIGECSTLEDKYAFRKAVSDDEFNSYPESKRREKFYSNYSVKQVQTNYKDVANTILKMAAKRALIGATLTATAAGDIFTQDLEDMEPQTRDSVINAEFSSGNQLSKSKENSNATLKDIMDSVKLLGNKCFTKEENGRSLLFVAGNCFTIKDTLKEMGFKYRKQEGQQYAETYMDVTHLVEEANPLGRPSIAVPKTFKEVEDRIHSVGLALEIVTIDGVEHAEIIGIKIFENKDTIKALGFKWSNDDSKSWRFDLSVFNNSSPVSKPEMNLKNISAQAEIYGYTLSAPALSEKGDKWIQAIPMDEHGDGTSLVNNLGFKFFLNKNIYALKVS